MNPDILLSVQGLSASADGKPILRDISIDIPAGQTHVIMGPNGAGKSTFGHVVMGDPAYSVDKGSIVFAGNDIVDLSPDKRSRAGVFLSFQAPVEIPGVPVSSFLRAQTAGREGIEMKGKRFRRRIAELAEKLDMDPSYLERELGVGFSGGEKKKLEMLQLLLLEPRLAILDETDSGLDVDALGVVSRGIRAYRESCDGTLVIITHNTRILENLSIDRVHVIVDGRLVESGDASLVEEIDRAGFERFARHADAEEAAGERAAFHCDHADEGLLGGKTDGHCVAADER
ncbi:MAG: Fe-S cluster assembly ATPase SufC [Slackia faecicanis]|nr:Fe-S cluster assembly ATPase SufC [Slackia faecicanis]